MRMGSCALIVGLSTVAMAQTTLAPSSVVPADQLVTAANGQTGRCMARTTSKRDGYDWTFVVPVPVDQQADFAAKGFQPAACGQMLSGLADHKRFVCEIAKGNEAVQAQTEAQLGIDAKKLCAAAKVLLPDADQPSAAAN